VRTHWPTWLLIGVVLAFWACRPDPHTNSDGDADGDGDGDGDADGDGDSDGDGDGDSDWVSNCAEGAEWVYAVGAGKNFFRFHPDVPDFELIGTLDCTDTADTPFSMSVDRNGTAWVLYSDGSLYNVSTEDATCTSTAYTGGQQGLQLFGMGFASNGTETNEETLFIAGGADADIASGSSTLATLDIGALSVSTVGSIDGWPELTGNGRGELWGFHPDTTPASVRQLDKATGDPIQTYDLDEFGTLSPQAWAFAFWGGRFYIFLQRQVDTSTHVWEFDPETQALEDILPDTGYRIVGAGVSTCAPIELY
jgi:hypothetical protein